MGVGVLRAVLQLRVLWECRQETRGYGKAGIDGVCGVVLSRSGNVGDFVSGGGVLLPSPPVISMIILSINFFPFLFSFLRLSPLSTVVWSVLGISFLSIPFSLCSALMAGDSYE